MTEQEIKNNFSKNLTVLRKSKNLTQLALAEKLNYSDKSISKWECADVLPDVTTFKMIADFFGVSVDELIGFEPPEKVTKTGSRIIITLLSCLGAILVSFVAERILYTVNVTQNVWIAYVYALPIMGIICVVFSSVWFSMLTREISVSFLVWAIGLSVYLSLLLFAIVNVWFLFVVCGILQIMVLLWFSLARRGKSLVKWMKIRGEE